MPIIFSKKKNTLKALMLSLNTCVMILSTMWCTNAMKAMAAFSFIKAQKLFVAITIMSTCGRRCTLAKMPNPNVPVMRRLLEMNFNLYYSRYALEGDRLCMRFDSDIETANPNKLYYGLKELSTKGDKQDDLLVQDFTSFKQSTQNTSLKFRPEEKEIKQQWLRNWINDTISYIKTLDADKFSGGIAYLLFALAYRIDYLIVPEGKILHDLEKIVGIYFKKDEDRPLKRTGI